MEPVKMISYGDDARKSILKGINKLADAVKEAARMILKNYR